MGQLNIKVSYEEAELILQALNYYGAIKEECDDLYDLIDNQINTKTDSI